MSDKALELFQKFNKEQGIKLSESAEPIAKEDRMTAGQMYKFISDKIGQKEASLFLLENGIDGVKYPAESISRGATSDTARGFNYVVFDENAVAIKNRVSFQKPKGTDATLQEVKKIAQKYNINSNGFAPKQVDEAALRRELSKLGYGAKRSRPTEGGYGGGVFITSPNGRFFNPFKVSKQRPSKAAMLEADPTAIEGYDQMVTILDEIAAKSKRRMDSDKDTANKLIDVMMTLPAYQKATDVQREAMVRGIRKRFGLKEISAPSVSRILGTIKDVNKITMSEKELLKRQIKDLARGARGAKQAFMLASAEITKGIKQMALSGKLSPKQTANVLRKFSGVNVFNQDSVDRFVEYMANVFQDAEYAENVSKAKGLSAIAKQNIKTKIGAANQIASDLRRMLSINPSLIPMPMFGKYMAILEKFGKRDAVLSLDDISSVSSDLTDILNAVNDEVSVAEEMAERFDYYQEKEYDADGNLLYSDTIQNMVDDGTINEREAEIMRKYKSVISPRAESTPMTEQEIQDEKDVLIRGILGQQIDASLLSSPDERSLAARLSKLMTRELLNKMTIAQLNNVAKLIDNINNGYMPHFAQLTLERLDSFKDAQIGVKSVEQAKPLPISKRYSQLKSAFTRKDSMVEMIRGTSLYFIDQVFGDFKTKGLFNALFSKMSESYSLFKSEIDEINKKLDVARNAVAKSFSYNANETLMSSFKMMTYMLQKEFESNPGSNQVNPAIEYLKKTIAELDKKGKKKSRIESEMLSEIIDKYSTNNQIDTKKLLDSFNEAEIDALKTIRELNDSMTDKAVFTAAVIRGKRIDPLANYVHHFVKSSFNPSDSASATELANQYNGTRTPSSRAMNLLDRKKSPTPLNFDVFASAQRGAKFTLLDYRMTESIRTARKTMAEMKSQVMANGATAEQKQILNAIESALDEVISNVLTNNFASDSLADQVLQFISKQGYRAVLASVPRFASELTSNVGFAMILDPKSFSVGAKLGGFLSGKDGLSFMRNVKSKETTRLYGGDSLSGRFVDASLLSQSSGVKSGEPVGEIRNVANMIYNISLKKYKNFVELVADSLISTPDKMVMRPAWFGAFSTEFKRQTGKEMDRDKITQNDEQYMSENADAIEAAKNFADERGVTVGASDNPFMGILKGTVKPNQRGITKAFNNFNTYMTKFATYEYITARQGIYAAMGNGSITRKQGVAMLAAVVTRMTVYSMLLSVLTNSMLSMFGEEDEDDDKTFFQKLSQGLASTMSSLILGRSFGNFTKSAINYGVEEINEEYLTEMRNGDYDPYKDAISFTVFPRGENTGSTRLDDILVRAGGSYSPALKTGQLIIKNIFQEPKKEADAIKRSEEEQGIRIPLEVLGNAGLVPLYKDVRKIVMSEMYKDLKVAEKNAADKKKAEEEMLHGYKNKTEMKRYDPELYEKTFGKDSPDYDSNEALKKIRKEKEDLERKMKDEFYDYVPKKKGEKDKKSEFGSKKFGSKKFGEK